MQQPFEAQPAARHLPEVSEPELMSPTKAVLLQAGHLSCDLTA